MTRLYAANLAYTTLDAPITSTTATTFNVVDPTNFPTEGQFIVTIGSEIMLIDSIDDFTFNVAERGYEGTTAAAHEAGAVVANKLTAGYLNAMFQAIEDKLDAPAGVVSIALDLEDSLNVQGTTDFGNDVTVNNHLLSQPTIKDYEEKQVDLGDISGALTLDLSLGNIFFGTVIGDITGVGITNASATNTNSLTLHLLSSGEHTIAWFLPYAVINSSANVSASDVDNSFNVVTDNFEAVVEPGDVITTSGFTNEENNGSFRVKTATASKITVVEDLVTEAAGETISISRRVEFFPGAEVPDAPEPFIPRTFTFWSYGDPSRWQISVAGDF